MAARRCDRVQIQSLAFAAAILCLAPPLSASAPTGGGLCELSIGHRNVLYNFSLLSPAPRHPHGVRSDDGFYKIVVNGSILWFQLCDQMIFNYDPPFCLGCEDCGGALQCGMKCSALVSNNIGGYDVCTTIARASSSHLSLIDKSDPKKGVLVRMVAIGRKNNCSFSVSVLCDPNVIEVSNSFVLLGECDYFATLRHPSGCARSISAGGHGWGWFATIFFIILCLVGVYVLVGTIYRYYFLRIHSVEAIPNLEFWVSLPRRIMNLAGNLVRELRSHLGDTRSSYRPVDG